MAPNGQLFWFFFLYIFLQTPFPWLFNLKKFRFDIFYNFKLRWNTGFLLMSDLNFVSLFTRIFWKYSSHLVNFHSKYFHFSMSCLWNYPDCILQTDISTQKQIQTWDLEITRRIAAFFLIFYLGLQPSAQKCLTIIICFLISFFRII